MTERKFTDEDIIKAFECCSNKAQINCHKCAYNRVVLCMNLVKRDALDLINRQRAELKALKMDNDQLQSDIVNATMNLESVQHELDKARAEIERLNYCRETNISSIAELHRSLLNARAEAIKEFAESMKKRERSNAYCCFCAHATIYGERAKECDEPYIDKDGKEHSHCFMFSKFESYIDKLVKEMTEGKQ